MCGIVGIAGGGGAVYLPLMLRQLLHRGPDAHAIVGDPEHECTVGHARLSIIDLSKASSQPMRSVGGEAILTYNGEIYNFQALRQELVGLGRAFRSSGDTEVLLQAYLEWGAGCLERLNGIYAFALWDYRKGTLFAARDPLGVKPFYYTTLTDGSLVFASEIKAILVVPEVRAAVDPLGLAQHLTYCHPSGNRTAFSGIQRLAPGHSLTWDPDTRRTLIKAFPSGPPAQRWGGSYEDATDRLRELAKNSVGRQMVSDVPVGVFFSGGLDSTLIAALAKPHAPSAFHGYTITYPESENLLDGAQHDGPFARRAAEELGLSHIEWEIKPDVVSLWPRLLRFLDEPIADPAAIACHLISSLARNNGTKVLLSGQGADELFGGYPRYWAMSATGLFDRLPGWVARMAAGFAERLPGAWEGRWGAALRRVRRLLSAVSLPPDRRFLSYCASTPLTRILPVLDRDFLRQLGESTPFDECQAHMDQRGLAGLDRYLDRDLSIYLPNHNLLYTDKMSMACGVEARVPLLDLELVRFVQSLPAEWKVQGRRLKGILKYAAKGVVPDWVIRRKKAGFGAPYRKWLRYDLAEMWEDLTSEASVKRRGWFDYQALKQIRELSQSGREDLYMLQWAVLTAELWAREFLDASPAGAT